MEFRLLKADEIEVRIASCKDENKGASFLLYKDARCDMKILDEIAGPENWQRKHYDCKGNLFCSLGIKCGNEWVWKDDCGSESNVEKEKGEASDSFKRACFNWGIGRELYTAPFIWINTIPEEKIKFENLSVSFIECNSQKEITKLVIVNKKGYERYSYGMGKVAKKDLSYTPEPPICKKCGKDIKASKIKGVAKTAQEVAAATGGICPACLAFDNNGN